MPDILPLVITVEGGIGVGKSTLIEYLKGIFANKMGISFVDEPVQEWLEHGFLQGMYDGSISTATFQHMVLQSLAGDLLKTIAAERPAVVITERSPHGNYQVFGKANLTGMDLTMYKYTWERVMAGMPSALDVRHLYLEADVDTVHERMTARDRGCESSITKEYIKRIHSLHEEWLSSVGPKACVRIDATKDKEEVLGAASSTIAGWILEVAAMHVQKRREQVVHGPEEEAARLKEIASVFS